MNDSGLNDVLFWAPTAPERSLHANDDYSNRQWFSFIPVYDQYGFINMNRLDKAWDRIGSLVSDAAAKFYTGNKEFCDALPGPVVLVGVSQGG